MMYRHRPRGVTTLFFFLMIRRPPRSTRTDTLFPYTTALPISRQIARRHLADMTYPEREQETVQRHLAPRVDGRDKIVDGGFGPAFPPDQLVAAAFQAKDVGGRTNQPVPEKAFDLRSEERRAGKRVVSKCRSRGVTER